MALTADYRQRTILEMVRHFQHRELNLDPGFQRDSVWSKRDRERLVQSIVSNYPLPNIFLYRRNSRGKTIYDVIDGKQRLETVLMFAGVGRFRREGFTARLALNNEKLDHWDWREIKKYAKDARYLFENYAFQTAEVSGELADIVDLFVRINSTGKRLTTGEKRHAKYFQTRFLQEAERLVHKYEKYFRGQRVLSSSQLARMKGTELVCELLMSIQQAGLINKKTALDRAMGNESINGNTLSRVVREFKETLSRVRRMFPDLKSTRFRNTAEFYSLFMLIWRMHSDGLALTDKKASRVAFELLKRLSTGVDELRDRYRLAKAAKPSPPYSAYLLTVQGDTDSAATRQRREHVLRALIYPLYAHKDGRRGFTSEQRRIIWNSDATQKCRKCKRKLVWEDFTVDHVISHVRGGKTRLDNAQLMCRPCNSRKGGR